MYVTTLFTEDNTTKKQAFKSLKIFLFLFDVAFYPLLLPLGGAVASWLLSSTPDRAVRARALAGDIVLCSWKRHLTLTVPLSTHVYKWVPANLMLNPAMD